MNGPRAARVPRCGQARMDVAALPPKPWQPGCASKAGRGPRLRHAQRLIKVGHREEHVGGAHKLALSCRRTQGRQGSALQEGGCHSWLGGWGHGKAALQGSRQFKPWRPCTARTGCAGIDAQYSNATAERSDADHSLFATHMCMCRAARRRRGPGSPPPASMPGCGHRTRLCSCQRHLRGWGWVGGHVQQATSRHSS